MDPTVLVLTYLVETYRFNGHVNEVEHLLSLRSRPIKFLWSLYGTPNLTTVQGTREVLNAILDRMEAMFNSTDRRLCMAQKTYNYNFDKHVTRPKNFKVGDNVFVKVPPTEVKTDKQRE